MRLDKSSEAQTYGMAMNVSLSAEFDPAPFIYSKFFKELFSKTNNEY